MLERRRGVAKGTIHVEGFKFIPSQKILKFSRPEMAFLGNFGALLTGICKEKYLFNKNL